MAPNALQISIVLFLVTTFCHGTRAQVSCTRVLISLSPCLNYVTGNSTAPSSSCCSQLANVVGSQPQCLCSVLNGGASSLGVTINQTQAMSLPSACNVKTPPVSQCNSANGPSASSPLTSPPADTSDETPDDQPPISSEEPTFQSGSKTVPTKEEWTSNGNNIKVPFHFNIFVLFFGSSLALSFISF